MRKWQMENCPAVWIAVAKGRKVFCVHTCVGDAIVLKS